MLYYPSLSIDLLIEPRCRAGDNGAMLELNGVPLDGLARIIVAETVQPKGLDLGETAPLPRTAASLSVAAMLLLSSNDSLLFCCGEASRTEVERMSDQLGVAVPGLPTPEKGMFTFAFTTLAAKAAAVQHWPGLRQEFSFSAYCGSHQELQKLFEAVTHCSELSQDPALAPDVIRQFIEMRFKRSTFGRLLPCLNWAILPDGSHNSQPGIYLPCHRLDEAIAALELVVNRDGFPVRRWLDTGETYRTFFAETV